MCLIRRSSRTEVYSAPQSLFFYLSNEGISIIENVALIGLPVPKKLKEVLEQLHEEADEKKEDE